MRKSLYKRVCACILSAFTLFGLVACKKTDSGDLPVSSVTEIADTDITLSQNGVSPYKIVVAKDASVSEGYSASTLQKYLELSTGAYIPVVTDAETELIKDGYVLSVGRNQLFRDSGISVSESEVSRDGYKIVRKDNAVYICGGGDVGTTFGVYEFLKYQIGFEPYTKDEIYYEKKETVKLKDFAYTDAPDFDFRMVDLYDKETAFLLRVVNTDQTNAKYAYAGSKDWTPGAFHTIRLVLPESEYASAHIKLLKKLIKDYATVAKRIKAFTKNFKARWLRDNKPFGWEIQQIRLGGLYSRVLDCRERLIEYVKGKVQDIPELEEDILPYEPSWGLNYNLWRGLISVGTI